jgi:hypothetical protein
MSFSKINLVITLTLPKSNPIANDPILKQYGLCLHYKTFDPKSELIKNTVGTVSED